MTKNDENLENLISSVRKAMLEFKSKNKNRTMLKTLAKLGPILDSKTRWNGKYLMLKRFLEIREKMIEVSDQQYSNISIDRSLYFKNKVEKFVSQLSEINSVSLDLQTSGQSLSDCYQAVDILLQNR